MDQRRGSFGSRATDETTLVELAGMRRQLSDEYPTRSF